MELLRARVVRSLPHDRDAFTQGLLIHDGKVYESTGLPGRSTLRRVDPESGAVQQRVALPPEFFGEGLARVGERLFQLTWRNRHVLVWGLRTFALEKQIEVPGEGWGLCYDGAKLVMTDGSDRLTFRDAQTFAKLGDIGVRRQGAPLPNLNELECVQGSVYANIWQDTHIARIDPGTGDVTAWIDAGGLLTAEESRGVDVLNGIAYWPERGHFLLTGKLWPRTFEVEFVPLGPTAAPRSKVGGE